MVANTEILRARQTGRPYLLCIRSGRSPRYLNWLNFGKARGWDLLISHYALPETGLEQRADILVTGGLTKLSTIVDIAKDERAIFSRYKAIALFDDDLVINFDDVDKMFNAFSRHQLLLGQPALTHQSYHSFRETLFCPSFSVRFTNLVEIMMPIFSASAFERCLPTFTEVTSGWGLDWVWPHILGAPKDRVGIIDDILVRHTSPIDTVSGAFYTFMRSLGVDPFEDKARVLAKYGLDDRIVHYGAITRKSGIRLVAAEPKPDAKP